MKLDRNTNADGLGKYALVKLRNKMTLEEKKALNLLAKSGHIHFGNEGEGEQFFVMKYKDVFACEGLKGYGQACLKSGHSSGNDSLIQFGSEVLREAKMARSQRFKHPD